MKTLYIFIVLFICIGISSAHADYMVFDMVSTSGNEHQIIVSLYSSETNNLIDEIVAGDPDRFLDPPIIGGGGVNETPPLSLGSGPSTITGAGCAFDQTGSNDTGGISGSSGDGNRVIPNAAATLADNVAPSPVPEPSTMLLLASGLAGLAGFGRKSFKK